TMDRPDGAHDRDASLGARSGAGWLAGRVSRLRKGDVLPRSPWGIVAGTHVSPVGAPEGRRRGETSPRRYARMRCASERERPRPPCAADELCQLARAVMRPGDHRHRLAPGIGADARPPAGL